MEFHLRNVESSSPRTCGIPTSRAIVLAVGSIGSSRDRPTRTFSVPAVASFSSRARTYDLRAYRCEPFPVHPSLGGCRSHHIPIMADLLEHSDQGGM